MYQDATSATMPLAGRGILAPTTGFPPNATQAKLATQLQPQEAKIAQQLLEARSFATDLAATRTVGSAAHALRLAAEHRLKAVGVLLSRLPRTEHADHRMLRYNAEAEVRVIQAELSRQDQRLRCPSQQASPSSASTKSPGHRGLTPPPDSPEPGALQSQQQQQHHQRRSPSLQDAVDAADVEKHKMQERINTDPYLRAVEGWTSSIIPDRMQDILHPELAVKGGDEQVEGLEEETVWRQRRREAREKLRAQEAQEYADMQAAVKACQARIDAKLAAVQQAAAAGQDEQQRRDAEERRRRREEREAEAQRQREAAEAKAAAAAAEAAAAASKAAVAPAAAAGEAQGLASREQGLPSPEQRGAPARKEAASGPGQQAAPAVQPAIAGGPPHSSTAVADASPASDVPAPPRHAKVSKAAWRQSLIKQKALETLTKSMEHTAWLEAQRALPPRQRETREISRAMNAVINGLSSTLEDIADKSRRVIAELSTRTGPARTEVLQQFAKKAIFQSSEMVSKSPQYAWPLAATLCEVADAAPEMDTLFVGLMASAEEGCPMTVPLYWAFQVEGQALEQDDWRKRNGYRRDENDDTKWESSADYLMRLSGALRLFAAYLVYAHPSALWSYAAGMLNAVPPNRTTASALLGFLQTGGHELWRRYGRQALKLFAVVQREWLPALAKQGAAAAAELTQLRLFCEKGFREEPEGSRIVESVQDSEATDAQERPSGGGGRYGGRGGNRAGGRGYGRR
eukprot:jgi/Ulvmu1/4226/UM019_0205.1